MAAPFSIAIIRSEAFAQIDQLIGNGPRGFRQAVKGATEAVARQAETLMKRVIEDGEFEGEKKHSPFTNKILAARASLRKNRYRGQFPQTPLFRNEEIYRAIRTVDLRNGDFFVGITKKKSKSKFDRRSTPSSTDSRLARIAKINEEGATLNVGSLPDEKRTKLKNFFIALSIAARKRGIDVSPLSDNTTIRIPPRSFRKPVVDAFQESGFGEGFIFEREAERAFWKGLQTNTFIRRFMRVVA